MAYSPCEADDNLQTQSPDPWYSALDYAPTPGNFGHASTPSCFSLDHVPNDHLPTNCQSQSTQLVFLPIADWAEERVYNKQPPIFIHYRIDWEVTINGKNIAQVTERDVVIKPSEFGSTR
jgi:hypothetical protein